MHKPLNAHTIPLQQTLLSPITDKETGSERWSDLPKVRQLAKYPSQDGQFEFLKGEDGEYDQKDLEFNQAPMDPLWLGTTSFIWVSGSKTVKDRENAISQDFYVG